MQIVSLETFRMKYRSLFSVKKNNKTNIMNLSPTEFVRRVVKNACLLNDMLLTLTEVLNDRT